MRGGKAGPKRCEEFMSATGSEAGGGSAGGAVNLSRNRYSLSFMGRRGVAERRSRFGLGLQTGNPVVDPRIESALRFRYVRQESTSTT